MGKEAVIRLYRSGRQIALQNIYWSGYLNGGDVGESILTRGWRSCHTVFAAV